MVGRGQGEKEFFKIAIYTQKKQNKKQKSFSKNIKKRPCGGHDHRGGSGGPPDELGGSVAWTRRETLVGVECELSGEC